MTNQVTNASGLDGITGWEGTGLAVDSTVRGAEGRLAITATGQLDTDADYEIDVTEGDQLEIFGLIWASAGEASFTGRFYEGGVFAQAQAVAVVERGSGTGRRGLRDNFDLAGWRGAAPITGTLRLRLASSDSEATVALVKPYAGAPAGGDAWAWSVGPHVNPDLDLPSWPETLAGPLLDTQATPTPMFAGYSTDTGVPMTHLVNPNPWQMVDVPLMLSLEQRDTLEQFYLDRHETFWFVRPGADQLCRAHWRDDGAPIDRFVSSTHSRTTVGLILEPA